MGPWVDSNLSGRNFAALGLFVVTILSSANASSEFSYDRQLAIELAISYTTEAPRASRSQPRDFWANLAWFSGFHTPCLEFFCSGAERSELVNRRARWREREGREGFGEHLVEVIQRGDAGTYVRAEPLAGLLRNERRHVLDQQAIVRRIVVRGGERADWSSFHRQWSDGGNQ